MGEYMDEFEKVAGDYKKLVEESLVIPNNDADYFANYRINYIKKLYGDDLSWKVLDYGCGIGLMSNQLQNTFPKARVHGFDVSTESIRNIPLSVREKGMFVSELNKLDNDYDMAILCNVMHHVDLAERFEVIQNIYKRLKKGGRILIFEHNPTNPLTRMVVDRCVFDKDAILLSPVEGIDYLEKNNFAKISRKYILFFPQQLQFLNCIDSLLSFCPLGAQYLLIGEK